MKKVFLALALAATVAVAAFTLQSCEETNYTFIYSVEITGDADGNVDVVFPNGKLNMDGKAGLDFVYSNDTTNYHTDVLNAMPLSAALTSSDPEVVKVALAAEEDVVAKFNAAAASGTYYVHVKGYAKEPITQITIAIDREFTNR